MKFVTTKPLRVNGAPYPAGAEVDIDDHDVALLLLNAGSVLPADAPARERFRRKEAPVWFSDLPGAVGVQQRH